MTNNLQAIRVSNNIKLLRGIAALLVIIIHVTQPITANYYTYGRGYWLFANMFNVLARFAVPIFFMISGAYLLENKDQSYKTFIKTKLFTLAKPFIVWSFLYYILICFQEHKEFGVIDFVNRFLNNNIYYHLWFYYDLVSIYLLVPLLRKIINSLDKKESHILLLIWAIFNSILPLVGNLFGIYTRFNNYIIVGNLGYFVLGYILKKYYMELKYKNKGRSLFILGYGSCLLLTYLSVHKDTGGVEQLFYEPNSITVLIMSIGIFVYICNIDINKIYFKKIINCISDNSLILYLIHPFILALMSNYHLLVSIIRIKYIGLLIYYVIVVILSLLISIIIRKIKILRKTLT